MANATIEKDKKSMEITIKIPDDFQNLSKSEQAQLILNTLEKLGNQNKAPKKSKWAQIADEIEALNISKEN